MSRRRTHADQNGRLNDIVSCRACGTLNEPAQYFCTECGFTLAAAPLHRRTRWWQRSN